LRDVYSCVNDSRAGQSTSG